MYFLFAVKILYTTMLFLYTYNNQDHQNRFQEFAWSLDSAGAEVKATILERSTKTNRICYLIMLLLGLTVVIIWPVWGDQNKLFLYTQVFEYFFGKWSQIPSNIYFATYSVVCYGSFQLSFVVLYIILQLQVQIILLNQQIMQIGNKFSRLDDWDKTYSVQYQKEISESLQIAIEQHCAIKKYEYVIVIYITNAVGHILQREIFRLKHDRAAGVF
jgi:ABC-type transport system substrate-binding protein